MKKRKKRPVKTSRAAALKAWRTRRQMQLARNDPPWHVAAIRFGTLDDMLPPEPTINLIPKVDWHK